MPKVSKGLSYEEVRVKLDKLERKTVYEAFAQCKNTNELKAFIAELMAQSEIAKLEERWFIAQNALHTGCSARNARKYQKYQYDKSSQGQVGRVYQELIPKRNTGYRLVYKRLFGLPADEAPE